MNNPVILCIDDEIIVLNALKEQLQQEFGDSLLIEIAESGSEALEIVDELIEDDIHVPMVIADFIMPEMNGDVLLSKIHEKIPYSKKIMLTGQASLEGVSNAVNKANLYRFLSKPWEKQDLMLTVKEAILSYRQEITISNQNQELKELNSHLEEKVAQRTKELEELNATKDKFFSIIAHDLKNPFNTLMGFSELMLLNLDTFSEAKVKEFINIIYETSKNSFSLLKNLLDWSRSQTGRMEMVVEEIVINEIVQEVNKLLQLHADKKDIHILNEIGSDVVAFADKNMIQTVIRNLISNAIKYTSPNGSVVLNSREEDGIVIISVSDTGVGISENNLKKLFRIDENFSTVGTDQEIGTGLGLILCKEFIEKNHGEIWVESELGKGSSFNFSLPVNSSISKE